MLLFVTRGLLDTLCTATGTTPSITLIGQYPCNGGNALSHSVFLFAQLPSTLLSFAAASHPYSGPYPNEIWPLHVLFFVFLLTCFLLMHPKLYLQLRSFLWLLACLICTVSPVVGLFTHPHAPQGTFWTTGFPLIGVIIQSQRIILRVSSACLGENFWKLITTYFSNTQAYMCHRSFCKIVFVESCKTVSSRRAIIFQFFPCKVISNTPMVTPTVTSHAASGFKWVDTESKLTTTMAVRYLRCLRVIEDTQVWNVSIHQKRGLNL